MGIVHRDRDRASDETQPDSEAITTTSSSTTGSHRDTDGGKRRLELEETWHELELEFAACLLA